MSKFTDKNKAADKELSHSNKKFSQLMNSYNTILHKNGGDHEAPEVLEYKKELNLMWEAHCGRLLYAKPELKLEFLHQIEKEKKVI